MSRRGGGLGLGAGAMGNRNAILEDQIWFMEKFGLTVTHFVNHYFAKAISLSKGTVLPQWTPFERRQWFILLIQLATSEFIQLLIPKMLQQYYQIENFLLLCSLSSLAPFVLTVRSLFTFIPCPRMAAFVSNTTLTFVFIILALSGFIVWKNYFMAYTYIMMIWPWLAIASMVSRLHIERNRQKNQFSPLRHLPILGMTGVLVRCLTMMGLKEISVTNVLVLTFLDPVWSALFGSILLGSGRRRLHFLFLKVYILLIVLVALFHLGEVSMQGGSGSFFPFNNYQMLVIGARILQTARSIYIKWNYVNFNDAEYPENPTETGKLFQNSFAPRKHRFRKFPQPVLLNLDAIFDSGLMDTEYHGMGPLGTKDLYLLSDFTYMLPVTSLMAWIYEKPKLQYGVLPPSLGVIATSGGGRRLLRGGAMGTAARQLQEAWVIEDSLTDFDKFKVALLIFTFCAAQYFQPWAVSRSLFDRGSSFHSWKYRPALVLIPFFFYDVQYLNPELTKFQMLLMLFLICVGGFYRAGLFNSFKRRYMLLCTQEMQYYQPSTFRELQKKTLLEFLEKTSTDDYSFLLLETAIHHGNNVRDIAKDTNLQVWDPAPSATAAWKLAASLVIKAVKKQKAQKKEKLQQKAEVVAAIGQWVDQIIERAVDTAEGHGKRLQLASLHARLAAKQRAIKRFRQLVERRKGLRFKRRSGQFSKAPAVLATSGGILRTIKDVMPPSQSKASNPRGVMGGPRLSGTGVPQVAGMTLPAVPGGGPEPISPTASQPGATGMSGDQASSQMAQSLPGQTGLSPSHASLAGLQTTLSYTVPQTLRGVPTLGWSAIDGGALPSPTSVALAFGEDSKGQLGVSFGGENSSQKRSHVASIDELRSKDIIQVCAAGTASFVLSARGKLYGFGSNRAMELGLRKELSQSLTPVAVKSLRDRGQVVQVASSPSASGQAHTLALTSDGEVLSFGTSATGALGQADVRQTAPLSIRLTRTVRMKQVACGSRHALLLSDEGVIFSCGENRRGQLGLGPPARMNKVDVPTRVETTLLTEQVWLITAGDEHNLCATRSGKIFAWGAGASGQLGIGKIADMPSPQELPKIGDSQAGTDVVSMACGSQHSLLVTDFGKKCWAFGSNSHGQLGTSSSVTGSGGAGVEEKQRVLPALVGPLSNREDGLVQVAAAANHSLALNRSGDVYAFGNNSFGQLGFLPKGSKVEQDPRLEASRTPGDGLAAVWSPLRVKALSFFTVQIISTADTHTIVLAS